jgi:hypothetical protein
VVFFVILGILYHAFSDFSTAGTDFFPIRHDAFIFLAEYAEMKFESSVFCGTLTGMKKGES